MSENPSDETTVADAKAWLRERLDPGADCPVCTQFAKVYRRKVHGCGVRGLIEMFRTYGREWGHLPSTAHLSRLGGEFARLRWWGLVEELQEKRDDGGRAGYWRVTEKGEKFLRNQVKVPKYALVYDGRLLAMEGEPVSVVEALGTKFNYQEMMAGV